MPFVSLMPRRSISIRSKSNRVTFAFLGIVLLLGAIAVTPIRVQAQMLYGVTFTDQLITINPATGAGTLVGTFGITSSPLGIARQGTSLYIYDQESDLIRPINTTTGTAGAGISIGSGDLIGEGDIAFRSDGIGFLATLNSNIGPRNLYRFDLSNGTRTTIGSTPMLLDGLAFSPSGILYGLSQAADDRGVSKLYTVDQTNASLTLVGSLGVSNPNVFFLGGLTFDANGTLYAALSNETVSSLYTINTSNGAATLIGNIGFNNVSGIAFSAPASTAAPEPTSLALLLPAVAITGMVVRKKRKSQPL